MKLQLDANNQVLLNTKRLLVDDRPTYTTGQYAQGGIVVYTYNDGLNGFVIDLSGNTSGIVTWGCPGINISTSAAILEGGNNTVNILALCYSPAAAYCTGLTSSGYNDWVMPSKDELTEIWNNRALLDSLSVNLWASGNQASNSTAYYLRVSDGALISQSVGLTSRVRAIRYF